MADRIDRNLGPYQVLERIGAGGMAMVYKAYQPAMSRYVAIKVLPQHLAHDPNFRARFQREVRAIAGLEHRYILPVYDVGEDEGTPYLVMRYADGGTLGDLIAQRSLSIERTLEITTQPNPVEQLRFTFYAWHQKNVKAILVSAYPPPPPPP